jgi:hypothetical protein
LSRSDLLDERPPNSRLSVRFSELISRDALASALFLGGVRSAAPTRNEVTLYWLSAAGVVVALTASAGQASAQLRLLLFALSIPGCLTIGRSLASRARSLH